jgi:hypothetical protein
MAMRLGDGARLDLAVAAHRAGRDSRPSPPLAARDAWIDALASGDPVPVEAAVAVFLESGYRISAADALADAAVLAARAGLASSAGQRAVALYQEMGARPLLGDPQQASQPAVLASVTIDAAVGGPESTRTGP